MSKQAETALLQRDVLDPQEALICTMVLVAAADGKMSDREIGVMAGQVQTLPIFHNFSSDRLDAATDAAVNLLNEEEGLNHAAKLIRDALEPRLRETAYALACEVIAADHVGSQASLEMLEFVMNELRLDPLVAAAIEHKPDIIVADISMPGFDGLQAVRRLREQNVEAKVIMLTMFADPEVAEEAIASGANGGRVTSTAWRRTSPSTCSSGPATGSPVRIVATTTTEERPRSGPTWASRSADGSSVRRRPWPVSSTQTWCKSTMWATTKVSPSLPWSSSREEACHRS